MSGLTSPTHIALLLLVLLLVFGAKRLPELGHSLGHGMREFKDSISATGRLEQPDRADATCLAEEAAPIDAQLVEAATLQAGTPGCPEPSLPRSGRQQ